MPSRRHPQAAGSLGSVKTIHEYRGYVFTIRYQPREPGYAVEFLDVPEVITSGATLPEAFANACEALDLHLESLQKGGMPCPEPRHHLTVQAT